MGSKDENLVIAVDGASGYLGNHLVAMLAKKNLPVRAIVHEKAAAEDCEFLLSTGAELFKCELNESSQNLKSALEGVSCLVHLVGSIAPKKGEKLEDLHAGQLKGVLSACRNSKTKIVLITALGSSSKADSLYHRSKFESESLLIASGLPYVILRPSLIIGKEVGRRNSKLISRYLHLIETRPRIPLVAGGKSLLQPVYIADLCEAIYKTATSEIYNGKIIEIGGPEQLSLADLVKVLMQLQGKEKPLLAIPSTLAYAAAGVLELFQTVPLLSKDQVKLALKDNICTNNEFETILGKKSVGLKEAIDSYSKKEARQGAQCGK